MTTQPAPVTIRARCPRCGTVHTATVTRNWTDATLNCCRQNAIFWLSPQGDVMHDGADFRPA